MNLDPRLLKQAWKTRSALLVTIAAGLLTSGLIVLQARALSMLIDRVFLQNENLTAVQSFLILLSAIAAGRALLAFVEQVAANAAAGQVKRALRWQLSEKILKLGPAFIQGEQTGELTAAALQGVEALDAYFSQFLPQLVLAAFIPLLVLAVVFPIDALSALVFLFTLPLIPIFMVLIGRMGEALTKRQFAALRRMSAYLLDTLQGLTTLKILNQSQAQAGRIAAVSEDYRKTTLSVLRITFLSALVLELVGTISTAVVAVEIGLRLMVGRMAFEQAFFILVLAPDYYLPLRMLGQRFHAGMAGISAARRIFEVLDTPVSACSGVEPLPETIFPVKFERVSYTYPGRKDQAVEQVSFVLEQGKRVAVVGLSGAGKSTLMNLLLGFMRPTAGQITVNGKDITVLDMAAWRRKVAWVPQQPHLYPGTLAENIRIGKPAAVEHEILEAARLVGLDPWIAELPGGLETRVGEEGALLSGGQAQRVALARALLKDSPIILFDEPTAHLDRITERNFMDVTREVLRGKAALIIAHRLETAASADWVVVLEEGVIVEQGSPADLLNQKGTFTRLVQAGGML